MTGQDDYVPMVAGMPERPRWFRYANCAGNASLMFDDDRVGSALAMCNGCPVKVACLELALEQDERHGVWGGLSPAQRRKLKLKLKRAAS